jgi:hypothetical protein
VFLPISPYATNENAGGVEKWRILKTLAAAFNKSKKNFFLDLLRAVAVV